MRPAWLKIHNDRRVAYWDGFDVGVGKRKFKRFKTKADAEAFADELERTAERSAGMTARHGTTWTDLCQLWVDAHDTRLLEGTMRRRVSSIRAWIVPIVGDVRVHDTQLSTLLAVADALAHAGVGVAQFNSTVQAMKLIADWAEGRQALPANPFGSEARRRQAVSKVRHLVKTNEQRHSNQHEKGITIDIVPTWDDVLRLAEEVKEIVAAITGSEDIGERYARAVRIAAGTGLRLCELLGLTTDQVDLESGLILVNEQLNRYIKWDASSEPMPRCHTKYKIIRTALVWGKVRDDLQAAVDDATDGVLFPPYNEQTWWADAWGSMLKRARDACNFPWAPHYLRHHYGSVSISPREAGGLGLSPAEVQLSMGHRNLTTTLDTYVHPIRRTEGWIE